MLHSAEVKGVPCPRAAFVCASAVGMALGPLLSLMLARLPERHVLGLTLNPITAAGWIMAAIWVAFIFLWLALFQEPLARCAACAGAAGPVRRLRRGGCL